MHVHFLGGLLALLFLAVILFGLWELLGIWLVYGPLLLGSLAGAVYLVSRVVGMRRDWRQRQLAEQCAAALALKRKTAASEAALGIPVPTEGVCPHCGHPLVAGARFCGGCGAAVPAVGNGRQVLPLVLCPRCAERQPDEQVRYCFACGATIAIPAPTIRPRRPAPAYVEAEPVSTWPGQGL
jgi:hypothetical protein